MPSKPPQKGRVRRIQAYALLSLTRNNKIALGRYEPVYKIFPAEDIAEIELLKEGEHLPIVPCTITYKLPSSKRKHK